MTIRPTSSGQTPRPGIRDAGRTAPSDPLARPQGDTTAPARGSGAQRDAVQISAQARDLQQQDAASRGPAELSSARLQQVLGRMNDGHYEQPEVVDHVIGRLAKDL